MNPLSLSGAPDLQDKSIRKIWIKNGKRRITTDSWYMDLDSKYSRKLFGNYKGGKYGQKQNA